MTTVKKTTKKSSRATKAAKTKSVKRKKMILSPSILSADAGNLRGALSRMKKAGCKWVHVDVMDGHFVPNITYGPVIVKSLKKNSGMFFDVHLMIDDPLKYAPAFAAAGADNITFHKECIKRNIVKAAQVIKKMVKMVSVCIKPGTPVSTLRNLLPHIDMVLVMTVEPGFGGQEIIPATINKVRELKQLREKMGLDFLIEVDGGITKSNVLCLYTAGADVIVAGSAVFERDKIEENIKNLHEAVESQKLH